MDTLERYQGFPVIFLSRRVIYVVVLGHNMFPLLSSRVSSMSVCVSSMFIDKTEMENRENTQRCRPIKGKRARRLDPTISKKKPARVCESQTSHATQ
jgi:hypothetical protein